MPFNGLGTFNSLPPPIFPAVAGTTIIAGDYNAVINDIHGGLSNTVTKDDPLYVLPANLLNGVDVAKGAALIGYKGRTVADRLDDLVSVKDKGAVCDGTTDDTAAIVAAMAALPATGGTIFFPGPCKTGTITIPLYPKNITFLGVGKETSFLIPNAQNIPLLVSAGQVSSIGGVRFTMIGMGMKPHASGSIGMAVNMRNMSSCLFRDCGIISNGTATFAVGFELYSQDSGGGASHCYYNVFEHIDIIPSIGSTTLPIKTAIKIYGSSGNHLIRRLKVVGVSPAPTTAAIISIAQYCRSTKIVDCHFEGTLLTGGNVVINDGGYGTYINAYFENTGQPYYSATEIESESREFCILEKCDFAANTVNTSSDAMMLGAVVRDCYSFGSDTDALAFIRRVEKIQRTESIAFNPPGSAIRKAATEWGNPQNFRLAMNARNNLRTEAEGVAAVLMQTAATGAKLTLATAPAGAAGSAVTYVTGLEVDHLGNISLRGMVQAASAVGVLGIANGTAPATAPTNGVYIWAQGGELKGMASTGRVTTLIPA